MIARICYLGPKLMLIGRAGKMPEKRHSLSVIRGDVSRKVYCTLIPRQPQTAERKSA